MIEMTKFTLNVVFNGGPLNGETMLNVPKNRLRSSLNMKRDAYFGTTDSDAIGVYQGELNSLWIYYLSDVYKFESMSDDEETVTYRYVETKEVNRCTAFTLKGTRCSKASQDGHMYCSEQHKPWVNPSLITDPSDLSNVVMPTGKSSCK
jgi:hypothetical protein